MSDTQTSVPTPMQFLRAMFRQPLYWIVPTLLCGAAATGYALLRAPEWKASQALLIRDEAGLSQEYFDQAEEMKTMQGTLAEVVRSRAVVEAALREVGPPVGYRHPGDWPSLEDVEKLQGRIAVKAPAGAEFGTTEVFYLEVEDTNRGRAVALTGALYTALENQLQDLRQRRAESLIEELTRIVAVSQADLDEVTGRLSTFESNVGADLPELRTLSEGLGGSGPLAGTISTIDGELRQAISQRNDRQELLAILLEARDDPTVLVATPSELLSSQPALSRLKDGLVDAQLRTSELAGTRTASHPEVRSAIQAEQRIREHLHQELALAIRGLEAEIQLADSRIAQLETKRDETRDRLSTLASQRTRYINLVAEAKAKSDLLQVAQENLADARASEAAALAASQLTRLEEPAAGAYPEGPRKAVIVLAGAMGGFLLGLGIVFLLAPASPQEEKQAARRAAGSRRHGLGWQLKDLWAHFTHRVPAHR